MTDPEPRPERPRSDSTFPQWFGAGAMALILVPQLLRVAAGRDDTITWTLLIASAVLLIVNVLAIIRARRERQARS